MLHVFTAYFKIYYTAVVSVLHGIYLKQMHLHFGKRNRNISNKSHSVKHVNTYLCLVKVYGASASILLPMRVYPTRRILGRFLAKLNVRADGKT